jgi:predicted nuclease of predicted toxin-antitoxin system
MKFLVDAQLPRRMVDWLAAASCDAVHTLTLPLGNRTSDGDFVNSHLLSGEPRKLLFVTTGNVSNRDLEQLLMPLIAKIVADFQQHSFLELNQSGIIIRG